jgi:hypothetical protein
MTEPTIHSQRLGPRPAEAVRQRERRSGSRRPVAFVRCFSPAPGTIFNASRGGVAIETFRCFKQGDRVFLVGEVEGRPQRAFGSVRWCRQIANAGGSNSPVYQIGIALAEPLEEHWFSALVASSEY